MNTSTCSRLNTSRAIRPSSRTPSTNRLFGGVEAAHVEHVAGGVRRAAAFAGLQRDAGHVAQRVAQRRRALLPRSPRAGSLRWSAAMSRSGPTYFGDSTVGRAAGHGDDSSDVRTSRRTLSAAVKPEPTSLPISSRSQRLLRRHHARHAGRLQCRRSMSCASATLMPGDALERADAVGDAAGGDVEAQRLRGLAGRCGVRSGVPRAGAPCA